MEDVKVKVSFCQECGNYIRVAVVEDMDEESKKEFAIEAMEHDLGVKTITLLEYRTSEVDFYCKDNCSRKNP